MINKIKLLLATSILSLLSACGGGGSGGVNVAPISSVPVQVAFKNIYATSWSASGSINGTRSVISTSCNGGNGGICSAVVTGNFTRTTTFSGLTSTTNYAQTFESQGTNTSYIATFTSDYSAISFGSCSLNLPVTVGIGYTQVGGCANMTVTASANPEVATLTINSSLGTEIYNVGKNGTVTPIKATRSGKLIPSWNLVDFTIDLIY